MKRCIICKQSLSKLSGISKRGFTIIETVAAITILSLVLVSTFAIAINIRIQLLAQERRLLAQQEITLVRSQVMARLDVDDVEPFLTARPNNPVIIARSSTVNELLIDGSPVSCETSAFESLCYVFEDEYHFQDDIEVVLGLRTQSGGIVLIEITVRVDYHVNRSTFVEGVVFVTN